jgi:hypothetical protein
MDSPATINEYKRLRKTDAMRGGGNRAIYLVSDTKLQIKGKPPLSHLS